METAPPAWNSPHEPRGAALRRGAVRVLDPRPCGGRRPGCRVGCASAGSCSLNDGTYMHIMHTHAFIYT